MIPLIVSLSLLLGPALAVEKPLTVLVRVLAASDDAGVQRDVLRGMADALTGRRNVKAPAGWTEVRRKLSASKDAEVRRRALAMAVLFGEEEALAILRRTLVDTRSNLGERQEALQLLLDRGTEGMHPLLVQLLDEPGLRRPALRGLARSGMADTPKIILEKYAKLTSDEKADAINTLASRPAFALALLDAIEKKQVERRDVTPFQARQIQALGDRKVSDKLEAVWGTIRGPGKDRLVLLTKYKKLATPELLGKAKRDAGRVVFAKHCASCHQLFGEGAKIGPDLTGAQRTNPDYVLGELLDPSAVVQREYQVTRLALSSGRILTGLIKQEFDQILVLQTPTEEVRIAKKDIEEREQQKASLMPEGMLAVLSDREIQDLLAYLGGAGQVELPKDTPMPARK